MFINNKRFTRFLIRKYAQLGAALRVDKRSRRAFRAKMDERVIESFRDEIEDFVSKYPKIYSDEETIRLITEKKRSLCRFSDGEFKLIVGERHKSFQDVNETLNSRMLEVLNSNHDDILIAIHPVRSFDTLGRIWQKFIIRIGKDVLELIDRSREYPTSMVFRNLPRNSKKSFIERVKLVKTIWQDRNVVLVVGKNSRFTFEDEIFNNAKSISFVYGPNKNAFAHYDELMSEIRQYDKDKYLILPVLGPTATVMAYDLAMEGYQAIDFGQMPGIFKKAKKHLYGSENADIPELNPHS